jgi:hypothetical protein
MASLLSFFFFVRGGHFADVFLCGGGLLWPPFHDVGVHVPVQIRFFP